VCGLSLIQGFCTEVSGQTADGDEGIALTRVPGWSTTEYLWTFEARRRGLYPNAPAEVETGFPFGLFRARRQATVKGQLVVWPQTVRLQGMPDACESHQTEEQFSERRTGEFGDTTGTRPFRDGDSLRRVHWPQTARQRALIVTEQQAPAMTSVRVILDLSNDSHPVSIREQSGELCVRTAASICESLHRQHSRVELVMGDRVFISGDSAAGYHRMMDALATAEVGLMTDAGRNTRRHGFEILVTTSQGNPQHSSHAVVIDVADSNGTPNQSHATRSSRSGWIRLAASHDIDERFPQLWRKACHDV
jgi:uncharacterized protein (DUF58 family)